MPSDARSPLGLRLGDWETLGEAAKAIRFEVFVDEQQVDPEIELDDLDAVCLHAIAADASGAAVGTGRLLPDGHIGRMAVRKCARGSGVGSALLQALMHEAKMRGDLRVVLSAQTHAAPFYARHGFAPEGDVYLDAGIDHILMQRVF
jgi:predicted GNAT family N-acyltransferase